MRHLLRSCVALASLALVAAGCGAGDDSIDTSSAPEASAADVDAGPEPDADAELEPGPVVETDTEPEPGDGDDGGASETSDPRLTVTPVMANGAGPADEFTAHIEAVAGTADDGPFYMVNLIDFADTAHYPEDSEFFGSSGAEANQRYGAVSEAAIAAVGGQRVFIGTVREVLLGDGIEWDIVAIIRYPSRQSILDLRDNEEFEAAVVHKWASVDNTFALVTEDLDLGPAALLPEVDYATVPHPPTDDDAPFVMFHLIDFHETAQYEPGDEPPDGPISGAAAVDIYSANAGTVAAPLGVRAEAWYDVVVPAVTDGRDWDQARLNPFPSRATFEALTSNEDWEAGLFHRTAGVEDTYAIMVNPLVWERDLVTD